MPNRATVANITAGSLSGLAGRTAGSSKTSNAAAVSKRDSPSTTRP
jgi:hypothetical protein